MTYTIDRFVRCTLVWLGTTAVLLGTALLLAQDAVEVSAQVREGNLADQSFETLLVWLCSLVAAACGVWLWLSSTAVIASVALGPATDHRAFRLRGCPGFVRRAVLIACGVAVVGSMAVPANAEPHAVDQPAHPVPQTLAGLPLPERAIRKAPPAAHPPSIRVVPIVRSDTASQVRVESGDSLWTIAAESLGADASTNAINDRWHDLYQLNRAVIGADPNLILPGQELRLDEA